MIYLMLDDHLDLFLSEETEPSAQFKELKVRLLDPLGDLKNLSRRHITQVYRDGPSEWSASGLLVERREQLRLGDEFA